MQDVEKAKESNKCKFSIIGAPTLGVVVLLIALFFQDKPFSKTETEAGTVPHWALLLTASFDKNFIQDVWFGVDLPKAKVTGERIQAFGIGALAIATLFFLGRFLFVPFSQTLHTNGIETWFFSGILGLIFLSFCLLIAGLLHCANLSLLPATLIVFSTGIALSIHGFVKSRKNLRTREYAHSKSREISWLQILLLFLFISFYACASTQPLFEYDALEYHAQGAREFIENGAIQFSTNNVYLNMPLGAEMFYLAGLNLARDFGFHGIDVLRIGLLVGKTILSSVALLTSLGILCFCIRFLDSARCGYWCALVFLSFPNLFEVYFNGLNDGVLGLAILAICYALLLSFVEVDSLTPKERLYNSTLLGIVAGFVASVKYTGVVFICIPSFIALSFLLWKPGLLKLFTTKDARGSEKAIAHNGSKVLTIILPLVVFFVAGTVVAGGWYAKNYVASGNPVYPLGYHVFGDSTHTWNDSINARWKKAHSSSEFGTEAFAESTARIFWKEDFDSPFYLYVPFVGMLSLFVAYVCRKEKKVCCFAIKLSLLFGVVVVYWIMWFFLTHRLIRFLTPITPIVALIVGIGVDYSLKSRSRVLRYCVLITALFSFLYSGLLIDIISQGRLAPLRSLEQDPARYSAVALYFNEHPELLKQNPTSSGNEQKILLVGEAKACGYHASVIYSTCWNDSPLMPMIEFGIERDSNNKVIGISDATIITEALVDADVSFIVVDFGELARFRSAGNYGYNHPEIDQNLFILMAEAGVVELYEPRDLEGKSPLTQIFKVVRK